MPACVKGSGYSQLKKPAIPRYRINENVRLKQREQVYRISAFYKLENFIIYSLCEIQGAFFKEELLTPIREGIA